MEPSPAAEADPWIVPAPAEGKGPVDWTAVFGSGHPLEIEVGPGKGVFLESIAKQRPETSFVGIEIRRLRILKIAKRLRVAGLANARVLSGDARGLVKEAFAPGSVRTVYLNFPDPWPKRKHAKRRIFRGDFPAWVRRILAPGGEWIAATDVRAYALEMLDAIEAGGLFENRAGPRALSPRPEGYPESVHERKFREWGREIFFMRWRMTSLHG